MALARNTIFITLRILSVLQKLGLLDSMSIDICAHVVMNNHIISEIGIISKSSRHFNRIIKKVRCAMIFFVFYCIATIVVLEPSLGECNE